jgi:hypothetical protein
MEGMLSGWCMGYACMEGMISGWCMGYEWQVGMVGAKYGGSKAYSKVWCGGAIL